MNKHIRNFAKKAGTTHKQNLGVYQFFEDELQTFAEMVVTDCLGRLCDEMDKNNVDLSNLPKWYKALESTERYYFIESN